MTRCWWRGLARWRTSSASPCSSPNSSPGKPGRYVPIKDTVRGFRMILDGEVDHVPEQDFYMAGPIEDVLDRYASREN